MWIDEYDNLMFSDTNDNEKIVKAVQLKYENMPEIFYKYRTVKDETLEAFKNDTLYFSSLSNLNDPYEGALMLSDEKVKEFFYEPLFRRLKPFLKPGYVISTENLYSESKLVDKILKGLKTQTSYEDQSEIMAMINYTNSEITRKRLEMQKGIIQIADELYRICSFSEISDEILMWSHYADNHTGFCIGYNFKEINNDLRELMLPVRYSEDILDITKFYFPDTNNSLIMNAMTRKLKSWEYEKEWRIWISAKSGQKVQPQKVPLAKVVYLGNRINDEDKIKIIEIAKIKNIDVYQMYKSGDEYKLYSEKIFL
ncbi:DUF2971 domain-containing protein [Clostridium sp.]